MNATTVAVGGVEIGVIYVFVNYLGRFGEPVVDVTHRLSMLQNAMVSATRVFELCDRSDARELRATGPLPADTLFTPKHLEHCDAVLAMYHDQGLIPFKTLSFGNGVNYTAGLNKIRTSPDHGTAYDIAGKGIASETSMRNAIYLAIDIYNSRVSHKENLRNSLEVQKPKEKQKEATKHKGLKKN